MLARCSYRYRVSPRCTAAPPKNPSVRRIRKQLSQRAKEKLPERLEKLLLNSNNITRLARKMATVSLPNTKDGKVMHPDLINESVKKAEYAVRGELYLRGQELLKEGKEIIFTNVGNPQALGAKPLTFNRQVLSLVVSPFLLENPKVSELYPADAIRRAKRILQQLKVGVGAYTDSRGSQAIREEIAKFIEERDGFSSNPENIFLTDGASVGVRLCLNALLRNANDCVLVPIPQYPLYSASITLYGGNMVGYYLNENADWSTNMQSIKAQVESARSQGKTVRGLVFINPGNPTGQCMSKDSLETMIKYAKDEGLVLMADEVYQENIYQDMRPFISARKAMMELGAPYNDVELISFHSVSKGVGGECGLRGGYFELTNVMPDTVAELYKVVSINLCPNTIGQVSMSLLVNQPKPGDESYASHEKEKEAELASLRRRAHMVTDAFNSMKNITCNMTEGAMYAFPRLHLPKKAMEAARAAGKAPDVFYCLKLLEATGISTVPGSGFGQEPDTWHLRTTILPREEKMEEFCNKFKEFNEAFMKEYADEEPTAASA